MATPIIDHNLLTLDYWQDSVTYEGKNRTRRHHWL